MELTNRGPEPQRSDAHNRMLSCLMEWTSDADTILAIIDSGVGNGEQIEDLARAIKLTLDDTGMPSDWVSEEDAQALCRNILTDPATRRVIARRAAATHEGVTFEQARVELGEWLMELRGENERV